MSHLTVSPAYGRDYTSQKAAIADWNADKDFIVETFFDSACGKPCNKSDIERHSKYDSVQIRFARMAKLAVVDVKR